MIFFFSSRRRHTRLQGDWSSDVCSSDLDQSTYVNLWRGTAVQTEVNYLLNSKGVPVGGTSAGLAVLRPFIYNREVGSVNPSPGLANPFHRFVTLDHRLFHFALGMGKIYHSHF